jgi:hypothetical protein
MSQADSGTQDIGRHERMRVTEELGSPWSSLILLVRERNGSFGSVWTVNS